ncbi:hypothetical protein WJX79_001271 [Trebouxia sp. C0005]
MPHANNGLIAINLSDLEAETRCPVCLGVIKNARLVSGCMHRFCAECIEKWLRVCRENNCPQCRMPMQSRRDCKKDGKYDRLLRLLYDDIEKYETEMLDADDAILEQAMQTGAALKKARDLQKAARKPRVDYPQSIGHAAGQQGSLQQPYGLEHRGPYRSIPVGPAQWPTKPLSDLKAEMQEGPSDQLQHNLEAAAAAEPMTHVAEEVPGHAASSLGQFDQGQYGSASQHQLQGHSQAQRWLTLQHTSHESTSGIKTESAAERMGEGRGTKRAGGGGDSKSKKRQRHGDKERSEEGDQSSGRQSTGPIAAFLRPLPPAQPEVEAKAMAASLAATAAANVQQQKHAVHAVVQIGQLQKHVTDELELAGQQNMSGLKFKMASGASNPATQDALPQQTLRELASLQHGMQQHLELVYRLAVSTL